MGMPSMPELLIILAIVVLLFGAKKIPDLAKGVGRGIKDFKKAIKEDEDGEENAKVTVDENKKVEQQNASAQTAKPSEEKKEA